MKKLGVKLVCLMLLLGSFGGVVAAADQMGTTASSTVSTSETTEESVQEEETESQPADLIDSEFALSESTFVYDGTEKKPQVLLQLGSTTLVEDTDFSVTYQNNINIGTAKVKVEGKGNFTGTVEKEFRIAPQEIEKAAVTLSTANYIYDGKQKTPAVTVKSGNTVLVNNRDYMIEYVNNMNPGTARVIISGKGNYSGRLEKTFSITQRSFNVKFDSKGGSSVAAQKVTEGNAAKTPKNPTRNGYQFSGWYTDNKLTKKYNFKTKITGNQTLFAKWDKKYTVKFDSKGGNKVSAQTVVNNGKAAQPKNPSRKNYLFAGWYSNSKLTQKYNFKTAVKKNVTLYAKWRKAKKLSVTFQSNGGSKVAKKIVLEMKKVSKPKNPKRTGYNFSGWHADKKLKRAYNFKSAVKKNTTLYAKWSKNKYTVSFNSNYGSAVKKQTVYYKAKVKKPKNPSRKGYKFAGWYGDKKLKKAYNFNASVTKNQTIYAKWTKNKASKGKAKIILTNRTTVYRVGNSKVYHVRKHLKKSTKYKAMTYKQAKQLHLRHCRANGCK